MGYQVLQKSLSEDVCLRPLSVVHEAHSCPGRRRSRRGKAESMSITSVLYLNDEVSVATAGAVDSVIKFLDTRNLKSPVTHASPSSESSNEERRLHGISSLSQALNGVYVTASCMDHRIYLYIILQLEKGPIKVFSGCRIDSFFVKSSISPDAAHIISGSTDANAYLWQVKKPHLGPISLKSHDAEVTAVDWCQSETGLVATCSDDFFTVRLWDIHSSFDLNTQSASLIRKRVRAVSCTEREQRFNNDTSHAKIDLKNTPSNKPNHVNSLDKPQVTTPESQKKKISFASDLKEDTKKTPESKTHSPYSVLNPPSSLKRKTIRDYFTVA